MIGVSNKEATHERKNVFSLLRGVLKVMSTVWSVFKKSFHTKYRSSASGCLLRAREYLCQDI